MPLSWNEIRDRSVAFVREWEDESSEHAEAKSFWDEFFRVRNLDTGETFEFPLTELLSYGARCDC